VSLHGNGLRYAVLADRFRINRHKIGQILFVDETLVKIELEVCEPLLKYTVDKTDDEAINRDS
jgi:hypothetical protein